VLHRLHRRDGDVLRREGAQKDFEGIDIVRTVRSFDPCLPCGVHMYDGRSRLLEVRHSPMLGAWNGASKLG
jgi:hydrogenase large subunit